MTASQLPSIARFGSTVARDLQLVSHDLDDLAAGGRWAATITFEGEATLARFGDWSQHPLTVSERGTWAPPRHWSSSLDTAEYARRVEAIRERIAAGDVYQVNLCRTLRATVPDTVDVAALADRLATGNPAPYGGFLRLPGRGVVSASPELFLRLESGLLTSGPIKGTARVRGGLGDKDAAENVMIVDLVRNDLSRVCAPGTVHVPDLLLEEQHPGLVHLVSRVQGRLRPRVTWPEILAATFPPGSVTGAPKIAALDIIRALEPVARGPYCGAFGWIDVDTGTAALAVAIRTFWIEGSTVRFGTGAGITWGSDPAQEWQETELKAQRLIGLAGALEGT